MKRTPFIIVTSILMLLSLFGTSCTLTVCTAPELVVTRTDDIAGGLCEEGNCTLRQAVYASNFCSGEQLIRIPSGTYTLTLTGTGENNNATGDLDIHDSVHIIGEGMPVIDGNASDQVFDIRAGVTVEMSGLVVQNGYNDGFYQQGGGITNAGTLTATGLLIRNNRSQPLGFEATAGGGLFNARTGNASISHSAILFNTSGVDSGGLANLGSMTLDNVTISGNVGYGIFSDGSSLSISYSTITNNVYESMPSFWSQIHSVLSPIVIRDSIISGYPEMISCWGEGYRSEGFNMEYSPVGTGPEDTCEFTESSDLVGVDPMLLPLSVYDGVTLPFHALNPASPAIDSADPANCSGTDQRGVARPQGSGCDRGSYERESSILPIITTEPLLPPPAAGITLTPPPQGVPVPPIITEIPCLPCILVIQVPANCRQGPGVNYAVVNSALPGEQVQVIGKSMDGTWWYSQLDNDKCFISNIAGIPQGDLNLLTTIPDPPTPVPTATEASGQEPEPTQPPVITDPDNDGDGYPFSTDCNDKDPKINPGAVEMLKDSVDSNCNGDINK